MDFQNIKDQIIEIISNIINIEKNKIFPEMKLSWNTGEQCLDINSYDYVSIIVEIERQFHITVDYSAVFNTVEDIVLYVINAVNSKE